MPRDTRNGLPVGARGLPLGRVAGIELVLAPSWLLMAALITIVYSGVVAESLQLARGTAVVVAFGFAVLLGVSVLLHELGHCLISLALGLPVRRVVLFLLGGVSEIDRDPQRPGDEYLIAIAGPLVSLLLAGCGAAALLHVDAATIGGELLFQVTVANGLVALFNLLPGLPLDGGRVLRAGVWRLTHSRLSATTAAVLIGRGVAVLVGVGALARLLLGQSGAVPGVAVAVLLAATIWVSAGQSLAAARAEDRGGWITLESVRRPTRTVPRDLPVSELLRAGAPETFVVVDGMGAPAAIGGLGAARAVPEKARPWTSAAVVARAIEPGAILAGTLSGAELLGAVRDRPHEQYVVVDDTGAVSGVLLAADLARALTGRGRPATRPAGAADGAR